MSNFCSHIDDYLDGDFENQSIEQWRTHLSECKQCRQVVEQYAVLKANIKAAWLSVEPDFPSRKKNRTERRERAKQAHWIWAVAPLIVVALFIALLAQFLPSKQNIADGSGSDSGNPPSASNKTQSQKAIVTVETNDPEGCDIIQPIEQNEKYTLVRYHQGVKPSLH
jgi:anti-sigma factor RsiW